MNILIVDDEPLIHISIEKLIQTCSDEDTIYHAYNGNKMLALIAELDIALAFVDIKMPGPSGLEAISKARELSAHTRYYIMTGFDEFEYAKQAIKLKVDDYLMKPLDLKTIRDVITAARLHVHINQEHKKNVFRNWLESTLNRRDSYFNEYVGHYCSVIVIRIDTEQIATADIWEPFLPYEDHMVSVFTGEGLVFLCFSENSEYLLEMYRALTCREYHPDITCFASSITRDPEELRSSLSELTRRACLRVLLGLGNFYYLAPLMDYNTRTLDFCESCLKWSDACISRDYTTFTSQSELIISQFSSQKELQKYQVNFLSFLASILGISEEMPVETAALKELLAQTAKEFLSGSTEDSRVQSIISFLQAHYQENISTAELSERFGLSANYISNLLKNTLGIRYNDYVTQLRLNHAKELLVSTRRSVKEIMAECGYFSQSHFTKLFLEHEGCTPLEYRKK